MTEAQKGLVETDTDYFGPVSNFSEAIEKKAKLLASFDEETFAQSVEDAVKKYSRLQTHQKNKTSIEKGIETE
eukprot:gene791-9041_t